MKLFIFLALLCVAYADDSVMLLLNQSSGTSFGITAGSPTITNNIPFAVAWTAFSPAEGLLSTAATGPNVTVQFKTRVRVFFSYQMQTASPPASNAFIFVNGVRTPPICFPGDIDVLLDLSAGDVVTPGISGGNTCGDTAITVTGLQALFTVFAESGIEAAKPVPAKSRSFFHW